MWNTREPIKRFPQTPIQRANQAENGETQMITIRPYGPSDSRMTMELFYETVHTVNARDYSQAQLNVWAPPDQDETEWNHSLLAHDTLVAEEDGRLVGFADLGENGYLDRLYVHSAFQGRGVARRLLERIEEKARDDRADRIYTFASITARGFFEHCGFAVLHENIVDRSGVKLLNFLMQKSLSKHKEG